MNVNKVLTEDYENKPNWTLGENEPNTNPTCRDVASGEAGSNPMLVRHQCGGTEAKKSCCRGNPHAGRRAGTAAKIKFVTVSLTSLGIDANLLALQFKEA